MKLPWEKKCSTGGNCYNTCKRHLFHERKQTEQEMRTRKEGDVHLFSLLSQISTSKFFWTWINRFILTLNSALFLLGSSTICFNVLSLSWYILSFVFFYAAITYHSVVLPMLCYHSQQPTSANRSSSATSLSGSSSTWSQRNM